MTKFVFIGLGVALLAPQPGDATFALIRETMEMIAKAVGDDRNLLNGQLGGLNRYGCWCYFDNEVGNGKGEPVDLIDAECKTLHNGYECIVADTEAGDDRNVHPYDANWPTRGDDQPSFLQKKKGKDFALAKPEDAPSQDSPNPGNGIPCEPWTTTYIPINNQASLRDYGVLGGCEYANRLGNGFGNNIFPDLGLCAMLACTVETHFTENIALIFQAGANPNSEFEHANGQFNPAVDGDCPVKDGIHSQAKYCCGEYPDRFPFKTDGRFHGEESRGCCGGVTFNSRVEKCCGLGKNNYLKTHYQGLDEKIVFPGDTSRDTDGIAVPYSNDRCPKRNVNCEAKVRDWTHKARFGIERCRKSNGADCKIAVSGTHVPYVPISNDNPCPADNDPNLGQFLYSKKIKVVYNRCRSKWHKFGDAAAGGGHDPTANLYADDPCTRDVNEEILAADLHATPQSLTN